jgi:DsbC/DsbD-like thiol-disulfide interchange protein
MLFLLAAVTLNGLSTMTPVDIYQNDQLQLSLISEYKALRPHGDNWLAVYFELAEGWHIYWQNPGDNGAPPEISLSLTEAFVAGEVLWPQPEKFYLDEFVDYGYHTALLMFPVNVIEGNDSVEINTNVTWFACKDICVPGAANLRLTLPVRRQTEKAFQSAIFDDVRQQIPVINEQIDATFAIHKDKLIVTLHDYDLYREQGRDLVYYPVTQKLIRNNVAPSVNVRNSGTELSFYVETYLKGLPEYFDVVIAGEYGRPIQIRARQVGDAG